APSTGTAGARIRHLDRSAKEAGGLQRAANDRFSIDKRIPVNEKDRASAPSPSPELRGPLRAAMASAPWMPGSAPGGRPEGCHTRGPAAFPDSKRIWSAP